MLLRIEKAKAGLRTAFKTQADRFLALQKARDSRLANFDHRAGVADDFLDFELTSCSIYELLTSSTDNAPDYQKFQQAQDDAAAWFDLRLCRDSRLRDYEDTSEDCEDDDSEFQEFQDLACWIWDLASDKANELYRAHVSRVRPRSRLPADCHHDQSEPEASPQSPHNKRTRNSTWGPPPDQTPACSAAQLE